MLQLISPGLLSFYGIDSDGEMQLPQTRQEKRQDIRDKEIRGTRLRQQKYLQLNGEPKLFNRRAATQAAQGNEHDGDMLKDAKFEEVSKHVSVLVLRVAVDLNELVPKDKQWIEGGRSEVIDVLARQHQVVDKYRQVFTPTSRYEFKVISEALQLLEKAGDIEIETCVGHSRLVARRSYRRCYCEYHSRHHKVRVA